MKNIFLTGRIQTGKSTAIRRALAAVADLDRKMLGGFLTVENPDTPTQADCIYLIAADGSEACCPENLAFRRTFQQGRRFRVKKETFEVRGCRMLRNTEGRKLILMDEIGTAEAGCENFHRQILETLAGELPVLGVLQSRSGGFLAEIRQHPGVELITVTEENREQVTERLISWLQKVCF